MTSDDDAAPTKAAPAAKPAMSRFLKTAAGSESSSSSSEEDSDEDSDEDESDEDVKKVIKSAKDKRLDEMEATGKTMNNALKIDDWVAVSNGKLELSFFCP